MSHRLRLFVTGREASSHRAVRNLRDLIGQLPGLLCEVEVVDVIDRPELAESDKILATPTLVRMEPRPIRKLVGDLSDRARVLAALEIHVDLEEGGERDP